MYQLSKRAGISTGWVAIFLLFSAVSHAQSLLNRLVNISVNRQPVQEVLEIVSNQGDFYFSYNTSIINRNRLVSISAGNRTVQSILEYIFPSGFEFLESGNYIILRRSPLKITLVTEQSESNDNIYHVTGYVRDDQTGEQLADASVYEKQRLVSALTNANGYFSIRLKSRYKKAALTVSKEFYQDTTVPIQAGYDQQLSITLTPAEISGTNVIVGPGTLPAPDSVYIAVPQPDSSTILYLYKKMDSIRVQRTAMGRFLLSSRLRVQSINLGKFFTARPVQISLTPGLSSNGRMNPQVVNNFSFNVFGGYSGGVNGFELGGLFNLDKKDMKYAQIGGLFNLVGGNMHGFQVGGLQNTVLDDAGGLQVGGINNFVRGQFSGVQIGGVVNFTNKSFEGLQIGGVGNITGNNMSGVQIGGVFNYAKRLKGVQIGLINISDSSEGYSIGLINVVFRGYHKLAFYSNEVLPFNAAFKTGNHKLYSILLGGANPDTSNKIFSFGYGIGREWKLGKSLALNFELNSQYLYMGSWDYLNLLNRATFSLQFRIGKYFGIYAGPAYNVFISDQDRKVAGYRYPVPGGSLKSNSLGGNRTGWLGWQAGFHFF